MERLAFEKENTSRTARNGSEEDEEGYPDAEAD